MARRTRRPRVAPISNILKLRESFRKITVRELNEGMGLIWGPPGLGKTTGACELYVQYNGFLVTARPGMRQGALLEALLAELDVSVSRPTGARMLGAAIDALRGTDRPLFVDECDFLLDSRTALESLRIIHDESRVPVLLIGMASVPGAAGIDVRIKKFPQIYDRIIEHIQFLPMNFNDLEMLSRVVVPEIQIVPELLDWLLVQTKGNVRQCKKTLYEFRYQAALLKKERLEYHDWVEEEDEPTRKGQKKKADGQNNVIRLEDAN